MRENQNVIVLRLRLFVPGITEVELYIVAGKMFIDSFHMSGFLVY